MGVTMQKLVINPEKAAQSSPAPNSEPRPDKRQMGQVTLVLQGGGALGAYQAGVYEAMHEAGIEPDWIIGTSIGAINGSLIAGNKPDMRLKALDSFWRQVQLRRTGGLEWANGFAWPAQVRGWADSFSTFATGLPGFFEPNYATLLGGPQTKVPVGKNGLYSTAPLRKTLHDLVDFSLIQPGGVRLTVGAARIGAALMCYFDSQATPLSIEHVMASGALPPAFPPVRIGEHYYWDGGILSNTPIEAVFDDCPRRSGVVFAVHVWNPSGPEPENLLQVLNRQKDIQYSSRAATHITRQKQIHKLRHIISELAASIPDERRREPEIAEMLSYGCPTQMHVVRLQAPPLMDENHMKDIDFSEASIRKRWRLGYEHTKHVIAAAPWKAEAGPHEGVIVHEFAQAG
jgi:NTE family protein